MDATKKAHKLAGLLRACAIAQREVAAAYKDCGWDLTASRWEVKARESVQAAEGLETKFPVC